MNQPSEDFSGDNDRYSDIELSLDEDPLIDQPISSYGVELTNSNILDIISNENKPGGLSTIDEESKDAFISYHNSGELPGYSEDQYPAHSDILSFISNADNGKTRSSKTSSKVSSRSKSPRSKVSNVSFRSSNSSGSNHRKCKEKYNNVMESIDKLKNISLGDSDKFEGSDLKALSHLEDNDTIDNKKNKTRVKINSVHQSVGSSFFNQNTTTSSKSNNYVQNSNGKNDQNTSIQEVKNPNVDQLEDMLINFRKNSVEVRVSENEVPLSKMKSFELLNNMIESTMDVLVKDHFTYLKENEAFFETCGGFLASYIPMSVDEGGINNSGKVSKIFEEKNTKENKSKSNKYVELTERINLSRRSRMSNQLEESYDVKSVDSAAFFAE